MLKNLGSATNRKKITSINQKEKFENIKYRPKNMPNPEIISDLGIYEGYYSTDYWPAEDAIFIHPPKEGPICVIMRGIEIGSIQAISAVVMTPKKNGPAISMSIGVSPSGQADCYSWQLYMGKKSHITPGSWGIVNSAALPKTDKIKYDVLIAAQVIGRQGNDNAWATFRRFSFEIRKDENIKG